MVNALHILLFDVSIQVACHVSSILVCKLLLLVLCCC